MREEREGAVQGEGRESRPKIIVSKESFPVEKWTGRHETKGSETKINIINSASGALVYMPR